MNSTRATARSTGILYLLMALMGAFNIMYIPSAIMVPRDATATARNIAGAELTYRIAILSGLVSCIAFIFLALRLYDLLKDVDRKQARLMVMLVAVSGTIGIVNLLNEVAPLILLSGADYLSVFTKPQLDALALGFLRLRTSGLAVNSAFWGLWLLPFGILAIKSGWIPKFIGVLLIVGCFAYLAGCFTFIIFPAQVPAVSKVTLPLAGAGELFMMLWLVFKGAKAPLPEARPSYAS